MLDVHGGFARVEWEEDHGVGKEAFLLKKTWKRRE